MEANQEPRFLCLDDGRRIAYHQCEGQPGRALPGVIFMGGFRSDMTGTKAAFLEETCREAGISYLRFDYTGHGASSGDFLKGSIGAWTRDAIDILDRLTEGPQILIGSSMGGWIMLNVAMARQARVHALIGIAAAPDFTEDLMWQAMTLAEQEQLMRDGQIEQPNDYSDEPYLITRRLIIDGREHLRLRSPLPLQVPVRLLHGMQDTDVPWQVGQRLIEHIGSDDAELLLIKNGDHRLSDFPHLEKLSATLRALVSAQSWACGWRAPSA
jgi:pimeloyl-ACP methyl ester carboxylesterase